MAFTYDLTTDIGKVRLNINDKVNTSDSPAQFSDAELQVFLTAGGNVNLGSALALEAWAAADFGLMDSESIGDYQYARGAVSKKLTLAKVYRKADSDTPVFEYGSFNLTGEEE